MKKKYIYAAVLILIIVFSAVRFLSGNSVTERRSFKMDTDITITGSGRNMNKAADEIEALLDEIDVNLNSYSAEGELAELNEKKEGVLSGGAAEAVYIAEDVRKNSDGAFNIAVKPLIDVWGFGRGGDGRVPSQNEIDEALKVVAETKIKVDGDKISVSGNGKIDLGAVAKGYASDKSREILKKNKVKYAVLNFGGNIVTYGKKPDGEDFVIGISDGEGGAYAAVRTAETCIVTSGGYERYFEFDGKKYHHLLNPHTGYPAENGLVSVTVISENGTLADALSTACYVSGLEKGMALAEKYKVCAVFLDEEKNVYTVGNPDISLEGDEYTLVKKERKAA